MPNTILRPSFTRLLLRKLQEGSSLNLVGLRGAGCSRALRDLSTLAQEQQDITCILVDINQYKHNYRGFIQQIQRQLLLPGGQKELPPPVEEGQYPAVSVVLDGKPFEHKQIFLLLNHFDALLNDPNQRLPKSFYDDLNSLNNRSGVSLCCVTERPHLQYQVHYKDEQGDLAVTLSWLDLQHQDLPHLLEEEIQAELDRLLAEQPAWREENQQNKYVNEIRNHLHPVRWMTLLQNDMETYPNGLTAEQRIEAVKQKYKDIYNTRPQPRSNVDIDTWLERLLKIRDIFGKK